MRLVIGLVLALWAGSAQAADLVVWDGADVPPDVEAPLRCLAKWQFSPIYVEAAGAFSDVVVAAGMVEGEGYWVMLLEDGAGGPVAHEGDLEDWRQPWSRTSVPSHIRALAWLCGLSWGEPVLWTPEDDVPSRLELDLEAGLPLLPE